MRRRPPRPSWPRSIMSAGKPRPRCARSRCACRGGALRSRSVELVWQELYGLALTHFALPDLMHEAALVGDCDVDTLSFTNTVKIVQSHVVLQGSFPPVHHPGTRMKIIREILRCPAEQSRGRHNARSVKRRTQSSFPNKKRKRNVSRTSTTYDYKTAIYIFPN